MPFNKDPNFWLSVGSGLLSGGTSQQQMANMGQNIAQYNMTAEQKAQAAAEKAKADATQNRTLQYLQQNDPELFQAAQAGLPVTDALKMHIENQQKAKAPKAYPAGVQEYEYAKQNGFQGSFMDFKQSGQRPLVTINDEMSQRRDAAEQLGIKPDNPAYNSYVLTGKLPREDQSPLTATDKKAILEADDMVSTNQAAIDALKKAKEVSPDANTGYTAGSRAWLGNNLPDWMVPDAVSSPNSSIATSNLDNVVVGTALAQMKSIFGGNPTEGERAILLQLQGASSQPEAVRQAIFDRAIKAAEARLAFNKQRAEQLRGQDYYKPGAMDKQPGANKTTSGVTWSVEGQ